MVFDSLNRNMITEHPSYLRTTPVGEDLMKQYLKELLNRLKMVTIAK